MEAALAFLLPRALVAVSDKEQEEDEDADGAQNAAYDGAGDRCAFARGAVKLWDAPSAVRFSLKAKAKAWLRVVGGNSYSLCLI